MLAALVVIGFSSKPIGKVALILDSMGLAFSAIAGVNLSLQHNVSIVAAVALGVLSAVLGGLIRDVLCQTPPVLLHRETNGTATFIGAVLFTILRHFNVQLAVNSIIAGLVVIAIRLLSIKFKINLPKIKRDK